MKYTKATILVIVVINILLLLVSNIMQKKTLLKRNNILEKEIVEIKSQLNKFNKKDEIREYINKRIPAHVSDSARYAIIQGILDSYRDYKIKDDIYNSINVYLSIINTESSFNTHAKSHKNCWGLMQINFKYKTWIENKAKEKGFILRSDSGITDPYYNVRLGCFYLYYLRYDILNGEKYKEVSEEEKDIMFILMYNFGPSNKIFDENTISELRYFKYYKTVSNIDAWS